MANVEELLIKITAENKELKAKLADSEKSVQKFGDVSKKISSMAAAGYAAMGAAVAAFAVSSFKAYDEQEKANKRLLFAVDGNVQKFNALTAQAEELRRATGVDDAAIMQIQQLGVGAGYTVTRVKKLTEAAIELAAKTGQDLQSAYMMLNQTFQGTAGRLTRMDGEFGTLTEAQLRNGGAIDLVLSKYKGFAAESATATDKLASSWDEFKESFGGAMAGVIVPALDTFNEKLEQINSKKSGWQKIVTFLSNMGGASVNVAVNSYYDATNAAKKWTPALVANKKALKASKEQAQANDVALQKLLDTQRAIAAMQELPDKKAEGKTEKSGGKSFAEQQEESLFKMQSENAKGRIEFNKLILENRKSTEGSIAEIVTKYSAETNAVVQGENQMRLNMMAQRTAAEEAAQQMYLQQTTSAYDQQVTSYQDMLNQKLISEQQYNDLVAKLDAERSAQHLAALSGMLGQAAQLFGQNTIAYKAFASAQAVIDTYLAANNALAQLPVPLNFIGAAVSIATGLANVAKINGVALAQGGLAYGPTSALIGEYAGASSNPEVIAPLDKLKTMIGGGSTQVYGRLYAGDIYLSNKRGARQMERRGAR